MSHHKQLFLSLSCIHRFTVYLDNAKNFLIDISLVCYVYIVDTQLQLFQCHKSRPSAKLKFKETRTKYQLKKIFFFKGEANMALLYGSKNTGKTLTQHIVHYGQGGVSLAHDLILSGGNSFSSGASA